jgi:hypothetical protein
MSTITANLCKCALPGTPVCPLEAEMKKQVYHAVNIVRMAIEPRRQHANMMLESMVNAGMARG